MIDELFFSRMKTILKDEYEAFRQEIENGERVKAYRINRIKTDKETFPSLHAFERTPVPYQDGAYIYHGEGIGNTPAHHAGAIYVQDPGAMSAIAAVPISKGMRVADLCAAPGGKSTQAAAAIGKSGFLIANEYVPSRAKITVGNFERLGLTNAMVTSLDTSEYPKLFSNYFDLVICDAPCSGEGMFRKCDDAITEWSIENINRCAKRQSEILTNAAGIVKAGGYLLYATCTYAPEENEDVIRAFLDANPSFFLVPVKNEVRRVTADGMATEEDRHSLAYCRRFYPHLSPGEGQFIALMQKKDTGERPKILYKDASRPLTKEEMKIVADFLHENLCEWSDLSLRALGNHIVAVADGMPVPPRSVFSAGVLIGEIRKGILFPHHQFFSAYGARFLRVLDLCENDTRISQYLHGEEIAAELKGGYAAVLCNGTALGGGKVTNGRLKNHYPKGLRTLK